MRSDYSVFISAKNLGDDGRSTMDREIAHGLWEFLTRRGLRVFFSNVSLERMGVSGYTRAIDDALDRAQVLVVVCSSGAYADSRWVRYEWDSFLNDVRSGIKPEGQVFVYLIKETIKNLPRGLRHTQCIEHGADGFERLARFISNATGQHSITEELLHTVEPVSVVGPAKLAGNWEGEWKRSAGTILHLGRLRIDQAGQRVSAQLTVTFEKMGRTTILQEDLRGFVTSRSIVLQGESVAYLERGLSTSYLLDHFELSLSSDGATLYGGVLQQKGTR